MQEDSGAIVLIKCISDIVGNALISTLAEGKINRKLSAVRRGRIRDYDEEIPDYAIHLVSFSNHIKAVCYL